MSKKTEELLQLKRDLNRLNEHNTTERYESMYRATDPYQNTILGVAMTQEEIRKAQQYVVDLHVVARMLAKQVEVCLEMEDLRPLWKKILHIK